MIFFYIKPNTRSHFQGNDHEKYNKKRMENSRSIRFSVGVLMILINVPNLSASYISCLERYRCLGAMTRDHGCGHDPEGHR